MAAAMPSMNVGAAEPAASSKPADPWGLPAKPAWLTDVGLSLKLGYDNNVYASRVAPWQDEGSFFTTISPKLGVNFAPLINSDPKSDGIQTLSVGYVADYTFFASTSSEDNLIHNFPAVLKGKAGAFSYNLDNTFRYVDGSDEGWIYPNGNSAYTTAISRERREQIQNRTKIVFRYDWDKFFLRPAGTLLYYDYLTAQKTGITGYQNYEDRYDVNGGLDVGYKINKDLAATIGYRYGSQYQDRVQAADLDVSNDYNRILFGIEGKPFKWMKVEAVVGPDFHHYSSNSGFKDRSIERVYADAGLTFDITAKDALSIKYKRWEWVSSTGKAAYEDSLLDLTYKRKLMDKLSCDLGFKVGEGDYHAPTVRDDWMYTASAGLHYAFNSHMGADLDYSVDFGRNGIDNLTDEYKREFTRQIVALTLRFKY